MESDLSAAPGVFHHLSCPEGQSEDEGRLRAPSSVGPIICPQAPQHGAEAHQTILGPGPRANIPKFFWRKAGSRGRRSAVVPAGTSWGEKGRRLRAELPPPARSRHVAAAPLGTAGKVQQEPGSRVRGEKVRRPPSPSPCRPVQPQTMEAQCFHSHFPLQGPVACKPPPSPAQDPGASPESDGNAAPPHNPFPTPGSCIHLEPLPPLPAPPATPDPDAAPPPPSQADRGERESQQPAQGRGVRVRVPGAPRPEGAKAG